MKFRLFIAALGVTVLAIALVLVSGSPVIAQDGGEDEGPDAQPYVSVPEDLRPSSAGIEAQANGALAPVFFTPQDSNDTNTVLFLYSTNDAVSVVFIRSFSLAGATVISTSVAIPPRGMVRISADTLVAVPAPPTSWTNTVIISFLDTSAYAQMLVPDGVKAEGYIAWNPGNLYNPRAITMVLPLRFSTDPSSVFLPAVLRN